MSMTDNLPQTDNVWTISLIAKIIIGVIFGITLFVGVIGNTLVLFLMVMTKKLHSTVNLCLGCLAVVDLIATVFLTIVPWLVLLELDHSFVGRNFCVFLTSLDRGVPVCSTLIFLLIGVERYTALCHPFKSLRLWTFKKVSLLLIIISVVSLVVCMPYGHFSAHETVLNTSDFYCNHDFENSWLIWYETAINCIFFFLPIPVLLFLYGKMIIALRAKVPSNDGHGTGLRGAPKSRSQVVMMIFVVVTMFVICLLPLKIYMFLRIYSLEALVSLGARSVFIFKWIARIMTFINHASNPIVYFLMSDNFKEAFRSVLCCRYRKNKSTRMSAAGRVLHRHGLSNNLECVT